MYLKEKLSSDEQYKPNVFLRNEPKLSEHEVDQNFNEMKSEFVPHIEQFVAEHNLFKDEDEVGIEFAHQGVSSIIAMIDSPTNKWVLKIPRAKDFSAGEGLFLKVWEASGVSVPHVLETGEIHNFPYTLMEFVNAPTVDARYSQEELLEKEMFVEMGQTLRLMHSERVKGYGFVVDGKPEFENIEDWLEGADMKKRFDYITEHNLLDGLEDTLEKSLEVIKNHAETKDSTYCHDDYGPHNMSATEPITIFDTSPKFNSGYYDLGRIKFAHITYGAARGATEQLLKGYFGEDMCNNEALEAYTFLAFCMKCLYWHQTGRQELLAKANRYFLS
jgi:hypothetical protein